MIDHLAIVNELATILRNQNPAWTGDRYRNAYRFATRIGDDFDAETVASLADDIGKNIGDFSNESGLPPNTLVRFRNILTGDRSGCWLPSGNFFHSNP